LFAIFFLDNKKTLYYSTICILKEYILKNYFLNKLLWWGRYGAMNDINKQQVVRRHMDQLIFDLKRGFLQFATLALINQGAKYAYEIKEEVLKITNGLFDIDRNNLYKKLRSLERDGLLKSYAEPSTQGANRKYYSLTPFGKKLLDEMYGLLRPVMDTFRKANKS